MTVATSRGRGLRAEVGGVVEQAVGDLAERAVARQRQAVRLK